MKMTPTSKQQIMFTGILFERDANILGDLG
jgi:hypothetical protein